MSTVIITAPMVSYIPRSVRPYMDPILQQRGNLRWEVCEKGSVPGLATK